jgi:hypothetical protein
MICTDQNSSIKKQKKHLDLYSFDTPNDLLPLKIDVSVPAVNNKQKNLVNKS